jgi:hypothetical protein
MYLGIFDSSTTTPKHPTSQNHPTSSFTHLYGGLKGQQESAPQQVAWKPVRYKDVVTYIRYAV